MTSAPNSPDTRSLEGEVKEILDLAGSVIADKGFQGSGYVAPPGCWPSPACCAPAASCCRPGRQPGTGPASDNRATDRPGPARRRQPPRRWPAILSRQPSPAASRRGPGRTVRRRPGHLVLAAVPGRLAGRPAPHNHQRAVRRPCPGRCHPGVLAQRTSDRQAATGITTAAKIHDLAPGSVTITVTVRQVITSTSGTTHADSNLVVTLTPQGAGWAVYDIEPASAGNS